MKSCLYSDQFLLPFGRHCLQAREPSKIIRIPIFLTRYLWVRMYRNREKTRGEPLQLRRSCVSLCLHYSSRRLLTPLQLQFPIVYVPPLDARTPFALTWKVSCFPLFTFFLLSPETPDSCRNDRQSLSWWHTYTVPPRPMLAAYAAIAVGSSDACVRKC